MGATYAANSSEVTLEAFDVTSELVGRFIFLGGAGADKDHLAAGILLLHQPGGEDHGGQGHGNILCLAGEQLINHGMPCRAAGSCHVILLSGHLLQEVLCLLDGTKVCPNCNFNCIFLFQSSNEP